MYCLQRDNTPMDIAIRDNHIDIVHYFIKNCNQDINTLNGSLNPPSASHPPHHSPTPSHLLIRDICDITVTVKKVAQKPTVLASYS